MLILVHSQVSTTPKIRATIQASDEPPWVLAERHRATEHTDWKWRKRDIIEDRGHTPHWVQTKLTSIQKAEAKEQLADWFRWARRSRQQAPLKKLAFNLKTHWNGILNGCDSTLSNGSVEAINGLVQTAAARARDYRKTRNFILMAYLIAAEFSRLSASPYRTTSRRRAA